MMVEIGLISYALDRNPSGIGHYTITLINVLNQAGLNPEILLSGGWPRKLQLLDYRITRLPGTKLLPSLMTLGQIQIGWQAYRKKLKLVHDPTGTIPLGCCSAKRLTTIHDTIPYIQPKTTNILDRLLYHYWLPHAIKQVDGIITTSQNSKKDIVRYFSISAPKITVVPETYRTQFRIMHRGEIESVLNQIGIERPYILFVGSVQPRKNLIRLLDAYQELHKWSKHWRLVIVGSLNYWKSSSIVEKVERLGLMGQVIFTEYIPDEYLPALYNGADLFCFPSLYEGFGLPVLEAMACGVPVVASNNSSLPEVTGEAAILIDPYNIDEITSAMRHVLEDSEVANHLRQQGLKRAAQFTWEKTARETIAVYEKVLGEKLL